MKSQFSLHPPHANHYIRTVGPEGVRIGDTVHPAPVLVSPSRIIKDWGPTSPDELEEEHFETLLALEPEVVLLGTGASQKFLHPARLAPLYRRQVGVEIMTTDAACRTYNVLAAEERRVVAALLPMTHST
jgi:uncharacterized protein